MKLIDFFCPAPGYCLVSALQQLSRHCSLLQVLELQKLFYFVDRFPLYSKRISLFVSFCGKRLNDPKIRPSAAAAVSSVALAEAWPPGIRPRLAFPRVLGAFLKKEQSTKDHFRQERPRQQRQQQRLSSKGDSSSTSSTTAAAATSAAARTARGAARRAFV